jgi:hypothetical protein
LKIPITIYTVAREDVVRNTIEKVSEILKGINDDGRNTNRQEKRYGHIIMNISSGKKLTSIKLAILGRILLASKAIDNT